MFQGLRRPCLGSKQLDRCRVSYVAGDLGPVEQRKQWSYGDQTQEEASLPMYEIRVIGSLGPAARQAFAGLAVEAEPTVTVLSGDLDRRGLQVLLNRMHAMGLELVAIRREPRA
jgi:hypothetical protein